MANTFKCPRCNGGYNYPLFTASPEAVASNPNFFKCEVCNGEGILHISRVPDIETGSIIHEFRVNQGFTLRQFCLTNNIDIKDMSLLERGVPNKFLTDRIREIFSKLPGGDLVTRSF